MSNAPAPQPNQDAELGITFSSAPERARGADGEPKMHTPTPEEMAQDSEASKQAGVFDVAKAFTAKHELGTIVTDKKRGRTSLSENLQSAWGQWWGGVKKNAAPALSNLGAKLEKNERMEARVPKAETRTAVIETAAKHAVMAPKDDHAVVIEKVKTFKRDVERVTGTPFTVKEAPKKPEDAAPRWSHTVDEKAPTPPKPPAPPPPARPVAAPDLRETMVAPVVEKRIKRDITDFYKKEPGRKAPEAPRKSTVANQLAYMHIPGTVAKREDPIPKRPAVAPVIQHSAEVSPAVSRDVPVPETVPEVGYVAKVKPESPVKPPRQGPAVGVQVPDVPLPGAIEAESLPEFHEEKQVPVQREPGTVERAGDAHEPILGDRARAALLWGAAPGAVLLGVIVFAVLMSGGGEPGTVERAEERETSPVAVAPEPSLIDVDEQTPIPLTSRRAFMETLASLVSRAPAGTRQFYPTAATEAGERTLTAEEFFRTLDTGLPESTVRSLNDTFVLGSITAGKNEAFLILRSSSFDALFAGMLAWERTIFSDLSPLFDDTYVEATSFTDRVRDNRPVRILYDAVGGEAMAYTFVGGNTVVITASVDALNRVVSGM